MTVRVGVLGASGRMGTAACHAIDAADDLDLVARLGSADLPDLLVDERVEVVVDLTRPDVVMGNLRFCVEHGISAVVGTSGFDEERLDEVRSWLSEKPAVGVVITANFAVGAVLMMRFAAEASRHMQRAEIIEYHHPAKLDAPSGTAARTAALMAGDVPIHSVRLPGVVADQDVILGDVSQTLTLRHVTTDRTSFMPGVLMAVRAVAGLPDRLTVGLERLLWP